MLRAPNRSDFKNLSGILMEQYQAGKDMKSIVYFVRRNEEIFDNAIVLIALRKLPRYPPLQDFPGFHILEAQG